MNYYRVILWARGRRIGDDARVADVELWADSVEAAQQKVYDDHWDPRLDAADCTPMYDVYGVDKDTGETFDL